MPSATAGRTAVPSDGEIADRFHSLLPELRSPALTIAARDRHDPDEVVAELLGFGWWNYQSAARRGKWLVMTGQAFVESG